MLVALDKNGERIFAKYATKEEDYFCPLCGEKVILRQSEIVIPHFAHKASSKCDSWTSDMSEWHMRMQNRYPDEWQEIVVEHNGEKHRADVLHDNIVIEFQHSPISSKEYQKRNKFYMDAGYTLIWVFDARKWSISHGHKYVYHWDYPKRFLSVSPDINVRNTQFGVWFFHLDDDIECLSRWSWKSADLRSISLINPYWLFSPEIDEKLFGKNLFMASYVTNDYRPIKLDEHFSSCDKYVANFVLNMFNDSWDNYNVYFYNPRYIPCEGYKIRCFDEMFFKNRDEYELYVLSCIAKMIIDCYLYIQFQLSGDNIASKFIFPEEPNGRLISPYDHKYNYTDRMKHIDFLRENKWGGIDNFNLHTDKTRERIAGILLNIWKLKVNKPNPFFEIRPDYYRIMDNGAPWMYAFCLLASGYACELSLFHEREWHECLSKGKDVVRICESCGRIIPTRIDECEYCGNNSLFRYMSNQECNDRMRFTGCDYI